MNSGRISLINERLAEIKKANGGILGAFSSWIRPAHTSIGINIPEYDFLRAEVFIDDLKEFTLQRFRIQDLIALLYADFINQVREDSNFKDLFYRLRERQHYASKEEVTRELKTVSTNHLRAKESAVRKRLVAIQVSISRTEAMRGEVLLHDMNAVDKTFNMSLSELITILIMDLLEQVKKGNSQPFINGIIQRFEST